MLPKRQEVVNSSGDRPPPGEAFTSFLMRIFPLNHRLTAAGELLAKRAGQTLARWLVLETVQSEPAAVAEIARRMGQARQGVQRHADLLVGDGLASYVANPRHRRANLLKITPEGLAALRVIQSAQRDWANRLGAEIGESELERASVVLDKALALVSSSLTTLQQAGTGDPIDRPQ
jgi:DNA-binding MarR family transcriptional regulator